MKRIVCDQLGRKVVVPHEPQRVVSLVPSITEYLVDLQIGLRLAGVTRYCTRPPDVLNGRVTVGGTKKFDFEKIAGLKPDLIIANKEENYQSGIDQLAGSYPVWISDINNLQEALGAMQSIADLVNSSEKGQLICDKINTLFDGFAASAPGL
ncbi:MAG: ABC transporter substrate-binding protein, partial [Gammaproteobacteria bacterium]|nr:ABC transporter substrate-binding protein [Gammaproteobacteria bacterium]